MVPVFQQAIEGGNFEKAGNILHQNWMAKKELSGMISNAELDNAYQLALGAGAFGGKILGAGGGGFLLVMAPPERHNNIKAALSDYQHTSFRFSNEGSQIIFNG